MLNSTTLAYSPWLDAWHWRSLTRCQRRGFLVVLPLNESTWVLIFSTLLVLVAQLQDGADVYMSVSWWWHFESSWLASEALSFFYTLDCLSFVFFSAWSLIWGFCLKTRRSKDVEKRCPSCSLSGGRGLAQRVCHVFWAHSSIINVFANLLMIFTSYFLSIIDQKLSWATESAASGDLLPYLRFDILRVLQRFELL